MKARWKFYLFGILVDDEELKLNCHSGQWKIGE